ncbi:MAG: hypothetical protein KGH98_00960 [Candidatus Micrarchaeota archaeon]|nr:hypothetical protein [Candidatus Micrarchaeota archaeon]
MSGFTKMNRPVVDSEQVRSYDVLRIAVKGGAIGVSSNLLHYRPSSFDRSGQAYGFVEYEDSRMNTTFRLNYRVTEGSPYVVRIEDGARVLQVKQLDPVKTTNDRNLYSIGYENIVDNIKGALVEVVLDYADSAGFNVLVSDNTDNAWIRQYLKRDGAYTVSDDKEHKGWLRVETASG